MSAPVKEAPAKGGVLRSPFLWIGVLLLLAIVGALVFSDSVADLARLFSGIGMPDLSPAERSQSGKVKLAGSSMRAVKAGALAGRTSLAPTLSQVRKP